MLDATEVPPLLACVARNNAKASAVLCYICCVYAPREESVSPHEADALPRSAPSIGCGSGRARQGMVAAA